MFFIRVCEAESIVVNVSVRWCTVAEVETAVARSQGDVEMPF